MATFRLIGSGLPSRLKGLCGYASAAIPARRALGLIPVTGTSHTPTPATGPHSLGSPLPWRGNSCRGG